jgi:hypothetical protein
LLNNAIFQTQGPGHEIREEEFKEKLVKHLESVDFQALKKDVERFIVNREELRFLECDPIKSLLRNYD